MKVTKENIENQQLLLTIEVEAEKLSQAKPQACKRLAERYTIPGFRKGKAPQNIIEQYVGKQAVLDEMFEITADAALDEAFETEKLTSITRPRVEPVTLEEGKDLVFKATLTPRPEVELGEYKNLKVEKEVKEITDEDVDHQIEHMAEHQANMVAAPEGSAVEKNDFIPLDFLGFIDGEPFIYGSPWSGKTPCYRNIRARLGAMTRIDRSPVNHCERLTAAQAFASILPACSSMQWDPEIHANLCNVITRIIETTPCFTMHCRPDQEAAVVCHKTIGR